MSTGFVTILKNEQSLVQRFGEALWGVVMSDPDGNKTETSFGLNFLIGMVKDMVCRVRKRTNAK